MMWRAAAGVVVVLALSGCDGDDGAAGVPPSAPSSSVDERSGGTETGAPPTPAPADVAPTSSSTVAAPTTVVPAPIPTSEVAVPADGAGGESLGPLGSTDVELTSEDGSVQIGSADLPGLADGFPLPEGTELELASETTTDAGFSGVAPGTVLDQADFYREALPAAGFTILDEQRPTGADDPDPAVVLFTFESDEREGELAITSAPGGDGASIIVTITRR
ncbi:MAG: hypothetical protein R8G01_01150 [Ilumatobacteraceae bacterium]|nr:hypothetical protein [Ilumatobacteraceae bacterium]